MLEEDVFEFNTSFHLAKYFLETKRKNSPNKNKNKLKHNQILLTCTNKSLLQIVSLRHLNVRTKNGLEFAAQVSTRKSSVFASKRLKCQKKHLAISQEEKTLFEKFITISLNSSDIPWKHYRILKQQSTILLILNVLFSTQSAGRDTYGDVSGFFRVRFHPLEINIQKGNWYVIA